MGNVTVKYNNQSINPVPLVNRSYSFIDYGSRHGSVEQITLNGFLAGIGADHLASIAEITDIFEQHFKTLEVFDDAASVYKWDNVVVEDISFPQSNFNVGAFTPYSVKILAYNVPSGVLEPSNEYSFTHNADGTVDVSHKISAKGIKNSNGALDNAINFVKTFVNKNPYTNCVPAFIPNGSGIRSNISETINRQTCAYSVTENFKYSTGQLVPYIETTSVSINDSKTADYTTINLEAKWQGSIDNNVTAIASSVTGMNLDTILSNYGISSTNAYRNSFSVNQDSGSNTIEIRSEYISGLSNDYSGYFDYAVSMEKDMVSDKTNWKIDGEFICKGPISFRKTRVAAFKSSNSTSSYIPYLKGLVETSAIYTGYSDYNINLPPNSLSVAENTGLATLKLSASFGDNDQYGSFIDPQYSVSVEPSIWVFESSPAANIEGHYIIQDLQMKRAAKSRFAFEAETSGITDAHVLSAKSLISVISGIYMGESFETSSSISSGITNISMENEVLGNENIVSEINSIKVYGSLSQDYKRPGKFSFGY